MSPINMVMTDTIDQHTHSEQDLYQVADLVLWTSIPTLTAREVAQHKTMSKSWAAWSSEHKHLITQARRRDVTRDWYFPLMTTNLTNQQLIPTHSWSWTGIWHAKVNHLADTVHSLPPLVHPWTHLNHPRYDIIACSGGLFLIKLLTSDDWIGAGAWQPLVVCNPFTKEWRHLPHPRNLSIYSSWFYIGAQVQMVVDGESNAYKVILLLKFSVCVYKSTAKKWTCMPFPQSGLWGNQSPLVPAWSYVCASVWAGGRFYVADVELAGPVVDMPDPRTYQVLVDAGHLRIFEIEENTGTWTQIRLSLEKWYMNFPHVNVRDRTTQFHETLGRPSYEFNTGILRYLSLVECLGHVYAIIPARLDEILQHPEGHRRHGDCGSCLQLQRLKYINEGVELMPLMFHIFEMQQGAIVSHGLLRIEVPRSKEDISLRRQNLLDLASHKHQPLKNWFSCTVEGSVLWVGVEQDYVMQYDVVTRKSRTHIIKSMSMDDVHMGFAYRPSLHMKP